MQAATLTLRINSNPVRRRCSDSQPTSTQSQAGCNRIQPTRDCAYDDINLHTTQTEAITALRVPTTARCNWLETMQAPVSTLNDYSNPVRRRCSDSQLTSPQSQVGCNRSSHAMATCGTVEHNNINLHTTQTEATTALRVTIIT